ncbi:hypothetical protein [Desulfurispira natronophila]|uniref:tRNA U34 2-thiouridine synthase MnmA/TrmU n=1 Tax=Desulfurispira natronophila TaxID=682562 RepID=A0A7W7Y679_9BACT|nr:hypothetical protein [Desulfurispira natronophila]MBB5022674.1 tRNA U34 2-thiouridine synthase MnmA/TrmU [Desulfurispira natronophila]
MKKIKLIAAFSGGLDSILAARAMVELGYEVLGIQFTSPFLGRSYLKEPPQEYIAKKEQDIGFRLHLVDLSAEHVEIVRNPQYGYGSQVNPCIDCKVLFFSRLRQMLESEGAAALVTGEVTGQRPMSQLLKSMRRIEKLAGLQGRIVRPLSGKLLPPTDLEKNGYLDREKLFAMQGRGRAEQIELAKIYGIDDYPTPAGGCYLTDPGMARRIRSLMKSPFEQMNVANSYLCLSGRQCLLDKARLVVGRHREECKYLPKLLQPGDTLLRMEDDRGAVALLRGKQSQENHRLAASIVARYSAKSVQRGYGVLLIQGEETHCYKAEPLDEMHLQQVLVK